MAAQKDAKTGRFLPGNKASPGRRKKSVERDYVKIITDVVNPDRWREIVMKAYQQAARGDAYARRWLGEYIIGKPPQILELRGTEAQQLHILLNTMKERGLTPGELFEAMLAEVAMQEAPDSAHEGYDDDER